MKLKPYFYYRQQYNVPNNSAEESKEIERENNNASQPIKKMPVPKSNDIYFEIGTTQHSNFQEVAPGIFQFKHSRRLNMSQVSPALFSQPAKKEPDKDTFIKVGTIPGAHGMHIYQFT